MSAADEVRPKVYGLMVLHPDQKPAIQAHCFGDCGKVSMAGVVMDKHLGGLYLCCEEACPHLQEQMDEPLGTTTFRHERGDTTYDLYLRKVKA